MKTRREHVETGARDPGSGGGDGSRSGYAGVLGLLPRFLGLVVNLLRDPRVSAADKAILGATVAYVLNPVDFVPDWVPFLGLVDDTYLVVLALLRLVLRTKEDVIREHWQGPDDILALLRKTADVAVAFLPARIRTSLFARVDVR